MHYSRLIALTLALCYLPAIGSAQKGSRSTTSRSSTAKASKSATSGYRDKNGRIVRSEKAVDDFKKQTGFSKGRSGYVIDHIVPLACGGTDAPSNMQWQSAGEAKAKDKTERIGCGRSK